ncbi:MAG: hypothetical protein P8Z50_02090 [candidate division WOR-3 bacterium]
MNELNEEKIEAIKNKVKASWLEDGMWEILWGIWFLLVSSGAFVIYIHKESPALKIAGVAMIIIGSVTPLLLWKYFRSRYSWSKGGYAILRNKYSVPSGIAVMTGLFSFFGYIFLSTKFKGVFLGLFIFFIFLSLYFSSGLKKFIVISSIPLLAGIISLLFKIPNEIIFNFIVFCPTGIALLIYGLKAFRGFQRRHY